MFPNLEVRHLNAAVVLAEELNFTKAAHRLHITQSALSKQITEVEEQHSFRLFSRKNKRHVELTEVGRIFVEEARSALRHIEREWILLARRVHPVVHGAIMEAARREGIAPKHAHDVITAQQAVHLVSEHVGVAILTKPMALGFRAEGVVVKPLSNTSLCFQTCVIMRSDDDSRLANEFARSFLRKYKPERLPPKQLELWLSA